MKNILIIGAGWLGLPLAQQLSTLNYPVMATRRSAQSVSELPLAEEQKVIIDLANCDAAEQVRHWVEARAIDVIVGCFPPGFRKGGGEEYAHQWQKLLDGIKGTQVEKVIMISSTTVYPNLSGEMREEDASLAKANAMPSMFSDKAHIMLQAEQSVVDCGKAYAILRLSGLFGPNRHPSRFVAHLKQVSQRAPANMLHLDDAVRAAIFSIENTSNEIFNVSTPNTVDKVTFYKAALKSAKIVCDFPEVVQVEDKRIVVDKLLNAGFNFTYQSTLDAL